MPRLAAGRDGVITVCLAAYTLRFPRGGAYAWLFLNWALGFRSLGCRLIWLDSVWPGTPLEAATVATLRARLAGHGLADLVVIQADGGAVPVACAGTLRLEDAAGADLFLNLGYDLTDAVVGRFSRSAFVDIDPGLTQFWLRSGQLHLARHDLYFTLGESVARAGASSAGLDWRYTPPAVCLEVWPPSPPAPDAAYTTVSDWWGQADWLVLDGTVLDNSKRAAFLDYLDLPRRTGAPLELALPLERAIDPTGDLDRLERHGWRVRHALEVSATPEAYQTYVRASRGEFTCMKRGYRLLETGWIGERALNYLASGKPVVVQHTGPSRFLPDGEGVLRFRTPEEAAGCLEAVERDWRRHSRAARALAEEYFDARKVAARVLELGLP